MERESWPIALTIAGSDSGGGAGIQADLKTFAALQVHGTSAITCITAQNPVEVRAVQELTPSMVQQQIEAVFAELPPAAIKTGMLFSSAIIEAVVETLRVAPSQIPLVVDPVFIATSGGRLLREEAVEALTKSLIPLAQLITPNVPEARALLRKPLNSQNDLKEAARELSLRHGCATLLKGGHLPQGNVVIDYFHHQGATTELSSTFIPGLKTHGTGCTLSAAIAALLARGLSMPDAVSRGKSFITHAITKGYNAGKHFTLHPSENVVCSAK
jgi:hydroxymethylpyrimidine kinase/phosphomethylpyrimidine kinase